MLPSLLAAALAASSLIPSVAGHAGGHTQDEVRAELALRNMVTAHARRAVGNCANSPAAEALKQNALARRIAAANAIREKRGLDSEHVRSRRDTASFQKWSTISHEKTSLGTITLDTPASTLFASNATCALVPETVIGPYYVEGELIRTDITDGQAGVPVHLDIQFVDLTTCSGIKSLLIDIWHCNSTGVYSGVAAEGQGGLSTTHGRGAQQTDLDGVVQFDTIFPGHYTGRANHIHVMATAEAELLPNATFTGGTARHIGQLYFDQSLIAAVEQLSPYSTNTQPLTTNAEDSIAPDEATAEYDPFLSYVMLGDSLQDGLLMWITVGLNTSADYSASVAAAAHYYEGGGVALDNGMEPGGSGVSDGLSLPSGFPPSGGLPPPGAIATGNRGANTTASGVVASGPTTTIATAVLTAGAARRGWGFGRR